MSTAMDTRVGGPPDPVVPTAISSPRGLPIRWQIAALLVATQLVAFAGALAFVIGGFDEAGTPVPVAVARDGLTPFSNVVGLSLRLPADLTPGLVSAALKHDPRLGLREDFVPLDRESLSGPSRIAMLALESSLSAYPDASVGIASTPDRDGIFNRLGYEVGYQLSDGRWLVFSPADSMALRSLPPTLLTLVIALFALPLIVLSVWAGNTLIAPLARLAQRTESLGADLDAPSPQPEGPREVRIVARTLGDMRARIRDLMEARTQTLAAIGHDLRTPLTRIRLRAEGIADAEARHAVLRDTETMARMIDQGLDYLRNRRRRRDVRRYDLMALLRTVVDELAVAAAGSGSAAPAINAEGPDRLVVSGDADRVRRALSNVVENAVRHGGHVDVRVANLGDSVDIAVGDSGPGIPAPDRNRVLEPFQRLDRSRAEETPGYGLGLSIARDAIVDEAGTLTLGKADLGGLLVRISLPIGPTPGIDAGREEERETSRGCD